MYDFEVGAISLSASLTAKRRQAALQLKRRQAAQQAQARARALAQARAAAARKKALAAAQARARAAAAAKALAARKAAALVAQKAKARGLSRAAQAHAANAARKKARVHATVRTVQAARAGSPTAQQQVKDTMLAASAGDPVAQSEANLMHKSAEFVSVQEDYEPEEALNEEEEAAEDFEDAAGEEYSADDEAEEIQAEDSTLDADAEESDAVQAVNGVLYDDDFEVGSFDDEIGAFGWLKKIGKKIGKAAKSVVRSKFIKVVAGVAAVVYPPVGIPAAAAVAASNKVLDAAEKGNKKAKQLIKNTKALAKKGDKDAARAVKLMSVTLKARRNPAVKQKLIAAVKNQKLSGVLVVKGGMSVPGVYQKVA